jgi:UDP:flavonoid glycosyltransferase YjiC (YdhE family)
VLQRLLDGVIAGPALAYAQDTLEAIDGLQPDVVVTQELLFGVMAAAEARRTPLALFTTNAWSFPDPLDQPPFGTGFPPAETEMDRARDAMVKTVTRQLFDAGRPALNAAREAIGLAPLENMLDQLQAADRVLLGVSRAWDFPTEQPPPEPFRYVGPVVEDPAWTAGWTSPWPEDDARPLVVVSFSTFFQGQTDQITRVIEALGPLPVRAVVTLGPALDPAAFSAPEHILVVQARPATTPRSQQAPSAPDHPRRPRHAGPKPSATVPTSCPPMGRDQADNGPSP